MDEALPGVRDNATGREFKRLAMRVWLDTARGRAQGMNDPGADGPDYTNEDMLADLLRTALHGLKCYHEYGQAMRGIGKGYDWNEYPGETTLSFIQRAHDTLKRMGK